MKVRFTRNFRPSAQALFLGAAVSLSLLLAFIASAQQPRQAAPRKSAASAASGDKPAEAVFKNIKSLKGQPATQLIPTMEFMSNSLGVTCEFCHDVKAFEKDTKDEKQTARQMIAMQQSINKVHFKGEREVTCNTCHHGAMHPAAAPTLPDLNADIPEPIHEHAAHHHPAETSSPTEFLDAFLQAAGGEAALAKLTSRTEQGTVSFSQGAESKFESYTRSSGQRSTSIALQQGQALSVFDGHKGWSIYPGHHSRQMSSGEAEATRVEADVEFPANFKQRYSQFRVGHPETISGKPANLLTATRPGEPPVRLYFDPTSKLLIRVIYYVETPLGRIPTQIDITTYASDGGLQLPSRWIVTRPDSRATYKVQSSNQNSPIDDSKFAPPPMTEAAVH
jgi:hypothetical protein